MRNRDLPRPESKIFTLHKGILANDLVSGVCGNADSIVPNHTHLYCLYVFMRKIGLWPYRSAEEARTSTLPSFTTIFIAPIKCSK